MACDIQFPSNYGCSVRSRTTRHVSDISTQYECMYGIYIVFYYDVTGVPDDIILHDIALYVEQQLCHGNRLGLGLGCIACSKDIYMYYVTKQLTCMKCT